MALEVSSYQSRWRWVCVGIINKWPWWNVIWDAFKMESIQYWLICWGFCGNCYSQTENRCQYYRYSDSPMWILWYVYPIELRDACLTKPCGAARHHVCASNGLMAWWFLWMVGCFLILSAPSLCFRQLHLPRRVCLRCSCAANQCT